MRSGTKGPQVILSRRDPELIKTLFELEVPEIADGLVEIRGVAREPGYRSKIAVESHAQGVDPVGACVGPRGSRVRMVVSELRGEKIDIIPWNPEPARFVAKALSPARVREVYLDDEAREATVVTPDDQLALAIGKEGMNARLAARLTGWKIDIQSDTEFAQAEAEAAFGGGERGRRGLLRPLRRDPRQRQALPERGAARLEVLRRPGSPGARAPRLRRRGPVVTEAEPGLEALADVIEPDAESVGPSLPELEVTEVELRSSGRRRRDSRAGRGRRRSGRGAEVDLDTVVPSRSGPRRTIRPRDPDRGRGGGVIVGRSRCGAAPAAAGVRRSASCSGSPPARASS